MIKHLLPAIIIVFTLASCSKIYEDRLMGKWKLNETYRQRLFDKDYFQTGFESGVFSFNENGTATYISNTDTLNGYWSADKYVDYYNNGNDGNQTYKYLKLHLIDFVRSKFIDWEFDDFNFRNDYDRIKARQFSLGSEIIYEFVRN